MGDQKNWNLLNTPTTAWSVPILNASTSCHLVSKNGQLIQELPPKKTYKRPNYCCDRLKKELDTNIDYDYNGMNDVSILVSHWGESDRMYISRCPFCGKKIKIIEVEE